MKKEFHLTQDGINELKNELDGLLASRVEIAEKLKVAREHGDLSENAEYHNARDEQAHLEARVSEIEHILQNVEVISRPKIKDVVELGNTVAMKGDRGTQSYTIVGSVESNPAENKISDESPIGKALLGKKVGEQVVISLPNGEQTYKIASIS